MVVSSITKAWGYTDQKGNYIKVWSNWKPIVDNLIKPKKITPIAWATYVSPEQEMFWSGIAPTKAPATPSDKDIIWTPKNITPKAPEQPKQVTPAPLTPITDPNKPWYTAPPATGKDAKISSIWTTATVPTDDYILDVNELTPEMKAVYDQMNPQQQKEFAAIWENARKAWQDTAKAYADYMVKYNEEKTYQENQQKIKAQVDQLWLENTKIASSERLDSAKMQMDNMKNNLAYLGTLWRPWVSSVQLDAVQQQLTSAQTTFDRLKQTEENAIKMRELWIEFDTESYERTMVKLEDQLNRDVSETIQDAINSFWVEVENIDTDEEFEALRIKILDQIDAKVAEYWAWTVEQMNFLSTQAAQIEKDYLEKAKLQGTINKDLSKAQGVLIDWLWKPVISSSTGMPIAYEAEAPLEPIRDKESGQLVSFAYWPNGEIVTTVDQVIEQPTFSQETFANLAKAVKNWYMTADQAMDIVPQASRGAFIQQLWWLSPKWSDKTIKVTNADWSESIFQYNEKSGKYDIPVWAPQGFEDPMWDLRGNADKFPWQAWAKNNNPAWIKTTISEATKKLLEDAWIQWTTGTPPPKWETGMYMNFETMADWLAAQKILLSQAWSNDIAQRLQAWVWRGKWPTYVADIMSDAWIPAWTQFTDLSDTELDNLLMSQIKFENRWLYDVLTGNTGSWWKTQWGVDLNQALATALEKCSSGAQCGKFVNDILEAAWSPRLIGNEYETKVKAIQTIWEAYSMEDVGSGSIFAYPVDGSKFGHIGIVTSVNDDWTINIMDYNYNNDEQKRERLNVNPWEILNKWGLLSKPIIREDTVPEEQQAQQPTEDLMAEAMGLTIWLWGTEWERKQIMKNIVDKATKDWITLQEAKKALKYRTPSDIDFSKNMNEQYDWIRKASWAMTQVKSAITALKNPNATTDLVGIVWLLKSIDPWSVARSDEVANVENARSVLDTFSVQWEKLKSWKKLSQEQRAQLINAMQTQVDSYQNRETEFAKEVINEYETRWMNPSDLFTKSIIDRAKWTAPASTQGSTNDDPLWILQ